MRGLVVRTQLAVMSFNNRAGNGQAHSHAAILGREEAIEKAAELL